MLVLARGVGQSVVLLLPDGGKIVVKVHESWQGKLVIDAPQNVRVLREEVYLKEQEDARNGCG